MNVTQNGFKNRQLHIEDYLRNRESMQRRSSIQGLLKKNDIITDFQTDNLMEQISHKDYLNKAYKKVKSNKGAGGVDGMSVDELLGFLRDNQMHLITDRSNGWGNEYRALKLTQFIRGWVNYFGMADMKRLL